jgi:hypothetical protein
VDLAETWTQYSVPEAQFELPDGQIITLDNERVFCFMDFYNADYNAVIHGEQMMQIPWSFQKLVWLGLRPHLLPELIRAIIRLCFVPVPTIQEMILNVSSEELRQNVVVCGGTGHFHRLDEFWSHRLGVTVKVPGTTKSTPLEGGLRLLKSKIKKSE